MAGATDTKLWDVVEDSQAIREKEGKTLIGSPDLEWEYLNNEQAELGEQGHPRNGSVRGICGSKSKRRGADMHETSPGSRHLVVQVCKKARDVSEKPPRYSPKMIGVTPGKQTSR
ncbi:hypothetical protein F5J12DRAFT_783017 [Pisolithus orientalis]|uniref:uncharacterized protein n=1 Tax=Pisolithus orientalis TaxID=936130 RepID=UPI0022252E6E|nr:uncharacterized protein F5J12DRAFT_783017 [Pisolithus orientalis]KAI6006241.1 hypothetical protein F5J12DRAFT_783017 [Pisolithus orientalis]